eukprot:TRINITY_DN14203_c0_g2_i3.p1 TRINITY_DN14203_c0_g2~~TRINITY_DN14203_c0_g2_i3.p1  ORF type:complete len:314 (-),score=16.32 TRINITY_DN14203_c0_g2_i3:283-1224(-)
MVGVLVTGGTGYLGQFLVHKFTALAEIDSIDKVAYTFSSSDLLPVDSPKVKGFKVDQRSGEGLQQALDFFDDGQLTAVINCAAISQPVACERDMQSARKLNVPSQLVSAMKEYKSKWKRAPLLIHISSDQVYEGTKAFWKEDDPCDPVNGYGWTKLEAEQFIRKEWPQYVILRSSIIFGPLPPFRSVGRTLFLQFIDQNLKEQKSTMFFQDEYRCPIYVQDFVTLIQSIVFQKGPIGLYNFGGPDRLSRVDMARLVAEYRGYKMDTIVPMKAASIDRGVRSPADISMDLTRLKTYQQFLPTGFREALRQIFPN